MLPCRFTGVVSDSRAVETGAGFRPASGGVAAVEVLPISNLVSVCGLSFFLSCIWFCRFGFSFFGGRSRRCLAHILYAS